MKYKIWLLTDYEENLVDPRRSPASLNYKTDLNTRLHPDMTFNQGELIRVDYFQNYDGEVYSDLILRTDIDWQREGDVLKRRVQTREWTLEDGSFGPDKKVTTKFYTPDMAALADTRRRQNIVDNMIAMVGRFNLIPQVQTMLKSMDTEVNAYLRTGDLELLSEINDYAAEWLEAPVPGYPYTLRQMIVAGLAV